MIQLKNITDNQNMTPISSKGCYTVYEHQKDMSIDPMTAETAYFMHEMNFRKRQVFCSLNGNTIKVQAGAMQWTAGSIESETGIKGVGGFLKNAVKGAVSGESAVKPKYSGNGYVMLEPTYKYIILEDVGSWGPDGIVLDDGLFLACDASLEEKIISRSNFSSLIAGGEGWFNLSLAGNGIAVLESFVPREELIEIQLENDTVKIDGNMAIAWSNTLQFTVERSSKSIVGSMINGEGLVNVFRGTGKILLAPTIPGTGMNNKNTPAPPKASKGIISGLTKTLRNNL